MNRQADTDVLDRPAAETAGKAERGLRKGFILGAAAGALAPVRGRRDRGAMGTDAALGVAYWWFWATPNQAPVLTTLRGCTFVGGCMYLLTCGPKSLRAAFWWGAGAGTCAPWLGGLAGRTVLELATGLASELASFL